MIEILKSKVMGFCFGVKNAIKIANKELDENGKLISYGEIIHNDDVIKSLNEKGLTVVDDLKDIQKDENTKLLIRSHGVGKKEEQYLIDNNIKYIDATCIKVKKIHQIVEEYSNKGYTIIIIGNKDHPEVQGIRGWVNGNSICVNSYEEFINLQIDKNEKYCLVSQTTFNYNIYKEVVEFIDKNDYTNIVRFNTICDATKDRQQSCVEIASQVDVMLIIGGKKSSNTKKLFELCSMYCEQTFLIENYREIPYKNIDKNTKIGITAGASTPDWVIEEVIQYVRQSE